MKKVLFVVSFMLLGLAAGAQSIVSDFISTLKGKNASFAYTYTLKADVPMSGKGTVSLQGNAFHMNGNGLDIWCDGKTRWTMDLTSDECYVESVDVSGADYEANPALLVGAIDKVFNLQSVKDLTFNGKKCKAAVMKPISNSTNFSGAMLYLVGKTPIGVSLAMDDGSAVIITISDFKLKDEIPVRSFSYDTKKLPKSYVINDLR